MATRRTPPSAAQDVLQPPHLIVCGVRIDAHTLESATEWVLQAARQHRPAAVHLCNAYTLSLARADAQFQHLLNRAEANFPDGMPLVWLIRRLGLSDMPRRVYGPDLMAAALDKGREAGVAHYLYGSTPEVIQRLRIELEDRFPGVKIAGEESPPFRPLSPEEQEAVIERIRSSGADLVWVGLGTPKQDRFVEDYKERIGLPLVAVGAAFDFHAGMLAQAPPAVQKAGLEWAYRLAKEPRRLWRRYLFGNASFIRCLVTEGTLVEQDVDVDGPLPAGKVVVIATAHNRRETTLRFLQSLRDQEGDLDLDVLLVDDGSTDGTGNDVHRKFPEVDVISGNGPLFWAGRMGVAFARAMERTPEFVLWANDDVVLESHALRRLLATYHSLQNQGWGDSVVVGAMADPTTGETTYSGVRRRIHRKDLQTVPPSSSRARRADTFNDSLVLIPRIAYSAVGKIDPTCHGLGGFALGLRSRQLGFEVWVGPGHAGSRRRNGAAARSAT